MLFGHRWILGTRKLNLLYLLDEAAIAADETQVNIPIISLPPDVQVGRVIHGNLQRDYKHELN